MSVLVAENVRKVYAGRVVVHGVSVTVHQGRVTGLLGPNGAGKTTTFYMVVGAVRPDAGSILLDGEDITRSPMHVRARRGIGYLAQEASIFRDLTVWDNVMAILEFLPLRRGERHARCQELLEELSLMHVKDSLGRALSGGERRRAEIARTLAASPSFILLDEPFAGVDPIAVGEIQKIVAYLREKGLGILITDHNVRETLSICDHTYVMNAGRILVEGGAHEIISNPEARKIYLGENFDMGGLSTRTASHGDDRTGIPTPTPSPAQTAPATTVAVPVPTHPVEADPGEAAAKASPTLRIPAAAVSPAPAWPTAPVPPSPSSTPVPDLPEAAPVAAPIPSNGSEPPSVPAWPPQPGRPLLSEPDPDEALDELAGGARIFDPPRTKGGRTASAGRGTPTAPLAWPPTPGRNGGR